MVDESRIFMDGLKGADVALLRRVAEEAAERAVKQTFLLMGLNPAEPIKAQRDFNFLRELVRDDELKADMNFLRRSRKRSEGALGRAVNTATAIAVTGGALAIWNYIKTAFGGFPHQP